ncbi:D-alanyl-D-alanine carboxypeptidase [Chryseobacterium sp. 52]|uniref:serine hydrolase domain-containing protein n=1 Tax=Chryseobacterium sp. 52 TaxID=2035213 RepID=UPI000C19350D|nr:serine hydrolase domain-containing protein [Chryseobacterium sp. 52]PIF46264.1 D-alanyl-D-alanine carboxypeptidase [Chryseobacterium sp. 52]
MKLKSLVLSLFISTGLFSQTIDNGKLDHYLNYIENNNLGMGGLSIFKDGKEVYNKSFGQKNIPNIVYNNDTKFQVGSVTKMVAATLILKLIENGRLKLDDKLSDFYPEIPNSKKITVKNLLEHTSGLGSYVVKNGEIWITEKRTEKEIFDYIMEQGVSFEPNEKVEYSNTAYYFLTKILEKKYKAPFHTILTKEITQPLQLNNFASVKSHPKNIFKSYQYENNAWKEVKEMEFESIIGVGDIASTPKNLNIFIESLFQNKIIKKETLEMMLPISGKETWGRGIELWDFDGIKFYGHRGGTVASRTILIHNTDANISIAYNTNGERIRTDQFIKNIVDLVYNKEIKLPEIK